jgi:TetR/AcrR family transcriptional regulator, cholesterol catabolism regulator
METRERIQVKANELFMRYGIRSVSMDDIAAQLGMSKKTIYQFFADKDELVDAVVDDEIRNMQLECAGCIQNSRDAVDEIFMMMQQIVEDFRNINPMVLYDLEKFHYKSYRKFIRYKDEFLSNVISGNIVRGYQGRILPAGNQRGYHGQVPPRIDDAYFQYRCISLPANTTQPM